MAEAFGLTFRSTAALALVLLAPVALLFLVTREHHRVRLARRFIAERLRGVANPARVMRPYAVALALLAAVIAFAGPRSGFTIVPVEERETNRVIVLDVSRSMDALDSGASRLEAGKAIAKRIIEAHTGRIALVVFEMRSEVVAPLTTDDDAVEALLESIHTDELSDPGTDLGVALEAAAKLIEGDLGQKGDIVVVSDGEDQGGRTDEVVRSLASRGIAVSTIALGSTSGSTIPRGEGGGDLRDDNGDTVYTYAHPELLQRVASATGGRAFVNPFGAHDLDALAAAPSGVARQKNVRVPVERFQWPLALACVALLFGSFVNRGAE
jgi:Ca-activated chloride channel family protein